MKRFNSSGTHRHSMPKSAAAACAMITVAGMATTVASATDSALTAATSFRASTFKISSQDQAVVTKLGMGDNQQLLAAWTSKRQHAGRSGVYFQRFTNDGVAIGEETSLTLWPESHQRSPAIAPTSTGMVAAWQSWGQDGEAGAIISRRFDFAPEASGALQLIGGDEVLVNAGTAGDQMRPLVASSASDRVLIAWTSTGEDGAATLRWRVFDADLDAVSEEQDVRPAAGSFAVTAASVSAIRHPDRGEGFAIAYGYTIDGNAAGIAIDIVDGSGRPLARGEISGVSGATPIEPVIAGAPFGLVAAWAQPEAGAGGGLTYRVFTQRFDHTGAALGAATAVGGGEGLQNAPAIEVMTDGSYVVAYNADDADGTGVFARRFDTDGRALGEPVALHGSAAGDQQIDLSGAARTTCLDNGRIAVAWTGDAADGDKNSANIALVDLGGALGSATRGVRADMRPAAFAAADVKSAAENAGAEPHIPPTFDRNAIDRGPRTISTGGRAIGFDAVLNTGWTPPDPHMAVGPSHVVVMTNGAIAFYRKSDGALTFQDQIEDSFGFWGSVGATGFVFDPEVLYDETTGRFFAMAAEGYAPNSSSYVLVAVSDDSDPNGTWYKYRFNTTGLAGDLFDSPNIGVSSDTVLITGDGFGISANYPVYTLRKSDLLAGLPTSFVRSTTLATTTQSAGFPPVSYDNPPAIYMIEHQEGASRTQVRLIALTNPFTGPTFTTFNLTVPTYSAPGDPVQQGTTSRPESFDARFWSVAYRNGRLWATHHINTTVQVRWYEIAMNGWPTSGSNPTLVQSGTLNPGANVNTTFSSITTTASGHAALSFAYSSPTNFLSMATTYRQYCDPLNTMKPVTIQKASNAAYTAGRWGDYSAVQVDPADGRTFWAVHEYSLGGSWRTWVQSFEPEFCPGECPADFDGSGFVDFDDFNAFVAAFELGDIAADFDGTGFVDFDDFNAYVKAYEAGC